MMHAADQFEIVFDDPKAAVELKLREQWACNRAVNAHNWTEEAMAMVWFLGRNDWEWWKSFKNYERENVIRLYQSEQRDLDWYNENLRFSPLHLAYHTGVWLRVFPKRQIIPTYAEVKRKYPDPDPKEMECQRESAQIMADQLSADWSANRPPSIFTYDTAKAGMVSLILGRRIDAIKPGEEPVE